MTATFSKAKQLKALIKAYPDAPVDIRGVILDYIGLTGARLDEVFDLNPKIYREIFLAADKSTAVSLLKSLVRSARDREPLIERCHNMYPIVQQLAPTFALPSPIK